MKLSKVIIHNYRGIIDGEFNLYDYTLLVGEKKKKKTTVINAIRTFFDQDISFNKEHDFPKSGYRDNNSWVEISFKLTQDESELLVEQLGENALSEENILKIKRFFISQEEKIKTNELYYCDSTNGYQKFCTVRQLKDEKKLGDVIYIPAVAKIEEQTKLTGKSTLRELIANILSDVVEKSLPYQDFKNSLELFTREIKKTKSNDNHSLEDFEHDFNEALKSWEVKFGLTFPAPPIEDIVKTILKWNLTDKQSGKEHDSENFGSGFQRLFMYSLIQLKAKYTSASPSEKSTKFSPRLTLLLFEEPEAFLHPPQQEILSRQLQVLSKSEQNQVLCSTHSAHFVNRNSEDLKALVKLKREHSVVKLFQISEDVWNELVSNNIALSKVLERYPKLKKGMEEEDSTREMEVLKHFLWLNSERSSLFFAKHVLLVEGVTEVALINKLVDDGVVDISSSDAYVMDCLGKFNIHRFISLLTILSINHSVFIDDDKSEEYHQDIHDFIEECRDSSLTTCIEFVPDNIEKYLGISPANRSDKKPQHVLYEYSEGKLNQDSLKEYCKLLAKCIPGAKVDETKFKTLTPSLV
ncbi:MAG: AAA family ATPase [Cyanobacteria bacterium HKST-UBA03]|nr:AAA family ATPase [Cyanobacteria bacterium HKST-UBA03]